MTETTTLSLCCKKRAGLVQLEGDVVLARLGANADFLDLALMGVALGQPLLLLILELAVVHDPADGRPLVGSDLDQIQIGFASLASGLRRC